MNEQAIIDAINSQTEQQFYFYLVICTLLGLGFGLRFWWGCLHA